MSGLLVITGSATPEPGNDLLFVALETLPILAVSTPDDRFLCGECIINVCVANPKLIFG